MTLRQWVAAHIEPDDDGPWGIPAPAARRIAGDLVGLVEAVHARDLVIRDLNPNNVMVTYGGDQSLDRYLAISARGVPFNVAHAAGNVALALAAGPALVRMIARYRQRFEFSWRRTSGASVRPGAVAGPLALLVVGLVLAAPALPARAAGARSWLESAQNADGGFGAAPGASSNPAMTGWAKSMA